jgi:hypothetical protein
MSPAQHILALVRAGALNQAAVDALNEVSAALTTEISLRSTGGWCRNDLAKDFVL